MKKRIAILLSALLALSLFGCSPSGYKLTERDGNYYITINVQNQYDDPSLNESEAVPHVTFSSLAEMKNDIKTGTFTEKEIYNIQRFEKNDNGEIQICNIDKLSEPILPDGYSIVDVTLYQGGYYPFTIKGNESSYGTFATLSKKDFDKALAACIAEPAKREDLQSTTTDTDRNATVYIGESKFGTQYKYIQYVIEKGSRTLYISEVYVLGESASFDVPYYILIFGAENGQYFRAHIPNLSSRPSVEWLSQFGIREYVETVTE